MAELSIGEVAERAGVATSAIRYYEKIGLLDAPTRLGGRRTYEPSVVQRLSLILLARDAGFSLDEIQVLVNQFPADTSPDKRWQALVPRKLKELDALSSRIQQMRKLLTQTLQCGCATLDECVAGLGKGKGRLTCGEPELVSLKV